MSKASGTTSAQAPDPAIRVVDAVNVMPDTRRGGDLRAMLTPAAVGATSGFMGTVRIAPGDFIAEHYHPFSEEFLYVVTGSVAIELDAVPHQLAAHQGLMVPVGVRHRLRNTGDTQARLVFHISPLAPRPDLAHVDTEWREDR